MNSDPYNNVITDADWGDISNDDCDGDELTPISLNKNYKTPQDKPVVSTNEFGETNEKEARPIVLLQGNGITITDSSNNTFKELGKTGKYFWFAGKVHKLVKSKNGFMLEVLKPEALRSEMEVHMRVMRLVVYKDKLVEKDAICSMDSAKAMLAAEASRNHLPHVRVITACPILTKDLEILNPGYHDVDGGILITGGDDVPEVPLDEAVLAIRGLLKDYTFVTPADESRGISNILTPVLKIGRHIDGICPVHVLESNESQSGKTTIGKAAARTINVIPKVVAPAKGGVGSLDEKISNELIAGSPLVIVDNLRGNFESALLEAAITSPEAVVLRPFGRAPTTVDMSHVSIVLTSNGVSLSKDLANRGCMIRIKKSNKAWSQYKEGDLLEHIRVNQSHYLGCCFSIIKEWINKEKPRTDSLEHDFRAWSQSLDWIIQNIFEMPSLLDGHRSIQTAVSTPAMVWLRSLTLAVESAGDLDCVLTAMNLAQLSDDGSLSYPNNKQYTDTDSAGRYVGIILGKVFKELNEVVVDNFTIIRTETAYYDEKNRSNEVKKHYKFTKM